MTFHSKNIIRTYLIFLMIDAEILYFRLINDYINWCKAGNCLQELQLLNYIDVSFVLCLLSRIGIYRNL